MENNIFIKSDNLKRLMYEVLRGVNVSEQDAEIVSDILLQADLRGVDTHGAIRLPIYIKRIQLGLVNPRPNLETIQETEATAVIDGDFGLGQLSSFRAMELAIKKAAATGIAAVGVRKSHHFGAAAYYAQMALNQDMIGISCTNSPPVMPAPGGAQEVVGNNPIAFAVPAGKEMPLVLDMACSLVAQGKVMLAMKKGEKIPEGWATDSQGIPTTDPVKGLKGFLLPFGGHKGYGLAMIIEALAGALTGAAVGKHVTSIYNDLQNKQNSGHFFIAIKVEKFIDPEFFKGIIDNFIQETKSTPLAPGVKEVFMPGEIEFLTAGKRKAEGIPMTAAVINDLVKMAEDAGVDGRALLGTN